MQLDSRKDRVAGLFRRRSSSLLVARIFEQGSLALMLVVLARRLGPAAFAPVSVLLIINSLAVTASDFGLGLDILRLPAHETLALQAIKRLRGVNGCIVVAAALLAVLVGSDTGVVIGFGGAIWALSAEAYVRGAGALRRGAARQTAVADVTGSGVALLIVLLAATGGVALAVVGSALVVRHALGAALLKGWRLDFSDDGALARPVALWLSQLLSFAIANVDFLVGGLVLGSEFLSLYLVAFRLSNAAPTQVAGVTTRLAVTDLAGLTQEIRQNTYTRFMTLVGIVGLGSAVLTIMATPLLPLILGSVWKPIAPIAAVLALAIPARLLMGLAGALALSIDQARLLVRVEVGRLVLVSTLLLLGGMLGDGPFVVGSAVSAILGAVALHYVIARRGCLNLPRWAGPSAGSFVVLACVCGMILI